MTLAESVAFWSENQVADLPLDITAEQSFAALDKRNALYPGLGILMPTTHQGVVLDYGCGPGHDTVDFLRNGAKLVFAADVSPKALAMTTARVEAHGWGDRLETMLIERRGYECSSNGFVTTRWELPNADYVHTAGVMHHVPDPVVTLRELAETGASEIRMMVYNSESDFYRRIAHGDPATFARMADGAAPITNAWTNAEVEEMAAEAGLEAVYVGGYRHPSEIEGPGLSSCWSLT